MLLLRISTKMSKKIEPKWLSFSFVIFIPEYSIYFLFFFFSKWDSTLVWFLIKWLHELVTAFASVNVSSVKHVQSVKKKEMRNSPADFNTNYCREIKPIIPINWDYCLFSFDAFKFSLEGRLHWGSLVNFIFFIVNSQAWQRNRKIQLLNCLDTNFHISHINLRVIMRRNHN